MKDHTNTAQLAIEPPEFYANEIDQTLCLGNPFFQEAVFFLKETRTAIFTDLTIDRSSKVLTFFARCFLRADGVVAPSGGIPRFYNWTTFHRSKVQLWAAKIKSWRLKRLFLAHSTRFSEPTMNVLNREFAFLDLLLLRRRRQKTAFSSEYPVAA